MSAAVDALIPRLLDYYRAEVRNACGGSLHIVVDDGNLGDADIEFCRREASAADDVAGVELADALQLLSIDERDELFNRYCEYSG